MPRLFRSSFIAALMAFTTPVGQAIAHQGASSDELTVGMGLGEVIGLIVGLLLLVGSFVLFMNYRIPKSGNNKAAK